MKFKMNEYMKCYKIESSFGEDNLIIPKAGEVLLLIVEYYALVKIKFLSCDYLFDKQIEEKCIERNVTFVNLIL